MKRYIRQFSIILFTALILFSTTGVAIYHHICGCYVPAVKTMQSAHTDHSCCDAQKLPEKAQCCTERDHDGCISGNHKGCRNKVTYLKAPIISLLPVQETKISDISLEMPDFRMPDAGLFSFELIDEQPYLTQYLIPPRAGGSLVILLQSIKIPSPEDLS